MKTQLLCTFTNQKNLDQITHNITKNFNVIFDKIYVLQNEDNTKELICTYNVDQNDDIDFNSVENTISLHRKKISNTLYTINALNELIKTINNGVLDTKLLYDMSQKNQKLVDGLGSKRIQNEIMNLISTTN